MDMGKVMQMVDELFQNKDQVSKEEVVQKAESPGMGDDVKQLAQKLPAGQYSKGDLQGKLTEMAGQGQMAGMGGKIGGMMGR